MEAQTQTTISIDGMFMRTIRAIHNNKPIAFKLPYTAILDNVYGLQFATVTPHFRRCAICNTSQSEYALNYHNDLFVCDECKNDYYRDCDECHKPMIFEDIPNNTTTKRNQVINQDGKHLFVCDVCLSSIYDYCDICKKYVVKSQIKEVRSNGSSKYLCPDCLKDFNDKNKKCTQCNTYFIPEKMKGSICIDCYISNATKKTKKEISSYGKTEGKIFLTTKDSGDCYGVEVEVSDGIESDALKIAMGEYPEIVLKRDGSVPRGFEIVSYPLSLGYHKTMMKWLKLFDLLNSNGYKSHDASNCGYHVHYSRLAMGDTVRKQSKYNAFYLYLIESNQTHFKKFSRRTDFGYCKFYNINYQNTTVTRAYQSAVNRNRHDRFMVLNYQNKHTVELRLFKGTINYQTFIAALEMMEHLKTICLKCKNESEIRSYNWNKIVSEIPAEFSNLKSYLAKKNLLTA